MAYASGGKNRRPRNCVWQHFEQVSKSKTGTHYVARCLYCNKTYPRGKVNTLLIHVGFACPNIPQSEKTSVLKTLEQESASKCDQPQIKKLKPCSGDSSQQLIANYCSSRDISKAVKQEIDREVLKCFICCNIPFRVAENLSFVTLMKKLRPGYVPPSRTRISEKLLWDETAQVIYDTQRQLQQSMNITIAVDGWTDITGKSIYA